MGLAELTGIIRNRGNALAGTIQSLAEASLREGDRWTFRQAFDLAAGGTETVLLDNDLSADALRVVAIRISTANAITGSVAANADGVGSGSALPAQNDRIDADVAALPAGVSVESGGSYSGGDASLPLETTGGTGAGTNRTALNQVPTANVRVEPGGSLLWTITEDSGNASKVVFEVTVARE